MGGLIFFAVIGIWFFIVLGVIFWIAKKLPERWWRIPISLLFFIVVLILPIIDEIVGGWQFKRLCEANSEIQVNRTTAVGKTVYFVPQPAVEIENKFVRIVLKTHKFVDSTTNEVVVSYKTFRANGGVLFKHISQGRVPLIFNGTCVPKNRPASVETFKPFGINYIEPPVIKNGDKNDNY
jgi:energy-coupling factor transporter transmembrane protein EcfT